MKKKVQTDAAYSYTFRILVRCRTFGDNSVFGYGFSKRAYILRPYG